MAKTGDNPFISDLQREAPAKIAAAPSHVKVKIAGKLRRMATIAEQSGEVINGHVQFLNFDHLKEAIGSKWERFRVTVYEKVDIELNKMLTKGDEFLRTSEHFYLIAFQGKSISDVQSLLSDLSNRVSKHFIGYPMHENDLLSVGSRSMPSSEFLEMINAIGSIYHQSEQLGAAKISQDMQRNNRTEEVLGSFQFRPAWDQKRETVFAYHGLLRHSYERSDRRYPVTGPDGLIGEDLRRHYDLMSVRRTAKMALDQQADGISSILLLPLSYATVTDDATFQKVQAILSKQKDLLKKVLAIELIEFPYDQSLLKWQRTVRDLSPMVGRVFINRRLESFQYFDVYSEAGIFGITIDMEGIERQPINVTSQVFGLVRDRAKRHGLKVFLKGVTLLEVAVVARERKIDYISGAVIGPWLRKPASMVKLDWKSIQSKAKDSL